MNNIKFTKDHEWVLLVENIATIGITNHAQESLGDIVFVELPEINLQVTKGSEVSVVESVKAASDIYTPLDGKIISVNEKLNDDASIINKDPENEGWIFKIEINEKKQLDDLMNKDQYQKFLEQNND